MEYTRAQQNTIEASNCSLIVAAGAGSGKTRVLTDRIISKLLDEKSGAEITEFLVVTFTKAAAKELSDRIRTSLVKKSEEGGKTDNIIKNLALLPQAKICTIDSFCYDLVKENFQKLGISPKTRLADENETAVIIERIFTEIIEERMRLEEGHEYFLPLYEVLSDKKSDSAFLKSLKDLYIKISNNANVKKFFENACGIYEEIYKADEIFLTRFGRALQEHISEMLGHARDLINEAISDCSESEALKKLCLPVLENEQQRLGILFSSLYTAYGDFCYSLSNLQQAKALSLKKAEGEKNAQAVRDKCSEARAVINDLKKYNLLAETELLKKCALDCHNLTKELSDIILEFHERFMKEKKEYGILDFADVEKLTLGILYDDEELTVESGTAKTLQNAFTEIYIDEYQDTNRIQDMIFRALTKKDGDGNECNRFMVGDSKQSIYGFRGARPDIFNGYKEEFDSFGSGSSRQKIFMNDNFRCAENIITFTNELFKKAMPEEYGKDEYLVYSKVEEGEKENSPVKLIICGSTEEKTDAAERIKMQAEAIYEEVCGLYGNENILSAEGKPYKYEDMAILTQRWADAMFLEKYFSDKNIPVSCEKGENFFDRREVNIALNILGAVDNPERDICVAGFMRSKAGGFDDNELAIIRSKTKDGSFYRAVREYTENGENEELKKKTALFCEK
ncbi:MAG: UvrD-helicase domain-containing protein, partial [Clostridia bacterium]|nr:UvrD-helicase domain-containing protein [Clostridia bacterium]